MALNPRILVMDDEEALVRTLKTIFPLSGFDTETAIDGEAAIKLYQKAQEEKRQEDTRGGGWQKLLHRLMNHRIGETGMMAPRTALHLDPDDDRREACGPDPSRDEQTGTPARIRQPNALR